MGEYCNNPSDDESGAEKAFDWGAMAELWNPLTDPLPAIISDTGLVILPDGETVGRANTSDKNNAPLN